MGGAQAGEIAARIAASVLARLLGGVGEAAIVALIQEANRRVYEAAATDETQAGMGTTVTAAVVEEDAVRIGHVGDSRAYRIRDGKLEQLTDDHSLVAELVRSGKLSPEEADVHPQRSVITRVLGTDPDVDVDTFLVEAQEGDIFMLCSDGLTSMVDDKAILGLVEGRRENLDKAARALVDAANKGGGEDNITVILFEVGEGVSEDTAALPVVEEPDADDERTLTEADVVPVADGDTMFVSREELEAAAGHHRKATRHAEGALRRRGGHIRHDPGRARRLEPLPLLLRRRPGGRTRRDLPGLPVEPGRKREALPRPLREHRARRPALADGAAKALRPRSAGLRPGARVREALRSRDRALGAVTERNRELVNLIAVGVITGLGFASVYIARQDLISAGSVSYGLIFIALYLAAHFVVRFTAPYADPYLLPLAGLLTAIGLTEIYRLGPTDAFRQGFWIVVGVAVFALTLVLLRDDFRVLESYKYLFGLASIALLVLPALPVIGARSTARGSG